MGRTSGWTRFGLTFVAVFLLCSGCDPAPQPVAATAPVVEGRGGGGGAGVSGIGGIGVVEEVEVEEDVEDEASKESADAGAADASFMEEQRLIIAAVQVQHKAAARSHRKAAKMMRGAGDLHQTVQRGRFQRLDGYARKQGWSMSSPPPEAARDSRLRGWWQEWRQLRKMGLR